MERAQISINGWMDKEDVHIYTMQYYSAIKKNEILPFGTTWMELEGIMLSEISQRKTKIIWLHSYEDSKRQNRWTERKGNKNNVKTGRGTKQKRLINMENKLRVTGGVVGAGWAQWVRGVKESTEIIASLYTN